MIASGTENPSNSSGGSFAVAGGPLSDRARINASWLIKLRWVAVAGQLLTILVVRFVLHIQIAMLPLLFALSVTAVSNLALVAWSRLRRRVDPRDAGRARWQGVLGSVMLLDLGNLTALLYFTGGMMNPFSLFYFVNLGLAGILLPSPWPWLLNALAVACVSVLFFQYHPVTALQSLDHGSLPSAGGRLTFSQAGLLAAFAACSSVIVYFTTRLTGELRGRERELRAAETRRARGEKLEALGTLAAGAAHELATPLSTIAVVVREIERELDTREAGALLQDDMRVLRQELERCRTILNRMSIDSGQAIGEPFTTVTAGQVIAAALAELPEAGSVTTESDDRADRGRLRVPLQGLAQALRGIVQNAVDASSSDQPVCVQLRGNGTHVHLSIRDQGPGMSPEIVQRVGEPFFTTKPPGSGMGLGVFLARSVVERLGGRLEIRSQPGSGTQVEIRLPTVDACGGDS